MGNRFLGAPVRLVSIKPLRRKFHMPLSCKHAAERLQLAGKLVAVGAVEEKLPI